MKKSDTTPVRVQQDQYREWCGSCQRTLKGDLQKFCPECGVKLNWEKQP